MPSDSKTFYCFYTHELFWVQDQPDLSNPSSLLTLANNMAEIVWKFENAKYSVQIARDGLIEFGYYVPLSIPNYLEYINALYLVFYSYCNQHNLLAFREIQQINYKNLILHEYTGPKISKFNLDTANLYTQYLYTSRFPFSYLPPDKLRETTQNDIYQELLRALILSNQANKARASKILTTEQIEEMNTLFAQLSQTYSNIVILSETLKVIGEYNQGNLDMVIVLTWFLIERYLATQYGKAKLYLRPGEMKGTSDDLNLNEALKTLRNKQFIDKQTIDEIYGIKNLRNRIVHNKSEQQATIQDAQLAIIILQQVIGWETEIELQLLPKPI